MDCKHIYICTCLLFPSLHPLSSATGYTWEIHRNPQTCLLNFKCHNLKSFETKWKTDILPSLPPKSRMLLICILAIDSCMDEGSAHPSHFSREIINQILSGVYTWSTCRCLSSLRITEITWSDLQLSETPVSWFKVRRILPPASGGAFGRGRGRANMTGTCLAPTMATKWI